MWLFGFRRKEKAPAEHGQESELFSTAISESCWNHNREWEEAEGLQFQLEAICSSSWAAGDLYTALAVLGKLSWLGREGGQCLPEMCLLLALLLAASGRRHLKTIFLNCTIWREEENR